MPRGGQCPLDARSCRSSRRDRLCAARARGARRLADQEEEEEGGDEGDDEEDDYEVPGGDYGPRLGRVVPAEEAGDDDDDDVFDQQAGSVSFPAATPPSSRHHLTGLVFRPSALRGVF